MISIIKAIEKHLIVRQKEKLFLLPGKEGFQEKGKLIINLSYYRFDIFDAFAKEHPDGLWRDLARDGEWLLHHSLFTPLKLPSDWISIDANLTVFPYKNKTFGYDAIRIPLNILQSRLPTRESLLQPYRDYVGMMKAGDMPLGTVQLEKGTIGLYDYGYGHLAIYDTLLPKPIFSKKLKIMIGDDKDDYYAYALYLLLFLSNLSLLCAKKEIHFSFELLKGDSNYRSIMQKKQIY
ncbi:MAG: glycosyl hydrolase family 8 [Sulfurovum sp.]|nr:glycosyl hydrolase family 8 [Sulfurovum sp.]